LGLTGCGPDVSFENQDSRQNKAEGTEDGDYLGISDPVDGEGPNEPDESEGEDSWTGNAEDCDAWAGVTLPTIPTTANDDLVLRSIAGQVNIAAVRDLEIQSVAGVLNVQQARNVSSATSIAGQFSLRAQNVGLLQSTAGRMCVSAQTIGDVISGAGTSTLVASSIESIVSVAGVLHIYGARVGEVQSVAGRICLHDGAVIENLGSSIAGRVGPCN